MKKKKLLSLLLVGAQLTALLTVSIPPVSAASLNPGHPEKPLSYVSNIIADAASEAPVIDGKIDDAFWKGAVNNKMRVLDDNSDRGMDVFGVKWDKTYLYVALTTKFSGDLKESTNREDSGDSMSFFFDPTAHQGAFDLKTGDIQLYLGYNPKADPKNAKYESGANCHVYFGSMEPFPKEASLIANTKSCMTKSEDGSTYIIEAAFRWEDLMISPQNEEYFAMNIYGNDVAWSTNNQDELSFWDRTQNYGKVTMVTRNITSLTPVSDNVEIPINTDINLSDVKLIANCSDGQSLTITGEYSGMIATPQNSNVTIANGKIHGALKGDAPVVFSLPNGIKTTVTFKVMNIALIAITPIPKQTAYANLPMSFTVEATNTLGNPMMYTAKNLPKGAVFDAATHTFSWTPSNDQVGDYNIHFDVTDGEALRGVDAEIHVGEEPNITVKPIADQVVQVGKPIAVFLSASSNIGSKLACSIDQLPTGSMFESDTMAFRWVPTADQIGDHVLKFTLSDGLSSRDLLVNIKVMKTLSDKIVFQSVPSQSVTAGERLTFPVKATVENGKALTYTVISKPADAVFDSANHQFIWQTDENDGGLYSFEVQASDGANSEKMSVTINVYSQNNSSGGSYGGGGGGGYTGSWSSGGTSSTTPNTGSSSSDTSSLPFKDMQGFSWAEDAVNTLYAAGVIKGTSTDTFSPAQNITRADFVLLLMRATKLSSTQQGSFEDVDAGSYYYNEVSAAKALGLISGQGGNQFNPSAPITRQDMMVILGRALSLLGISLPTSTALDTFEDSSTISAYAKDAISGLVSAKLVCGNDGAILPMENATRAEIAVLLNRIMKAYGTAFAK